MEFLHLEDNVRDPEKGASLNVDGTTLYKEATIYCNECQTYQKLTTRNSIHATPPSHAKQRVYYGLCYTDSCLEQIQEKAIKKRIDDLFFAQEKYLMSRCNTADAKCDAFSIKHGIRFGDQEDADAKFLEMEHLQDIAYDELISVKKRIFAENQFKK